VRVCSNSHVRVYTCQSRDCSTFVHVMLTTVDIAPSRLTLRACHDLGWRVTAYCSRCGNGREMRLADVAASPLGGRSIEGLLDRGAITCRNERTQCGGEPAHALQVSTLRVGQYVTVAFWAVEVINGQRKARLEARPA